jgi:hypothetical protein
MVKKVTGNLVVKVERVGQRVHQRNLSGKW